MAIRWSTGLVLLAAPPLAFALPGGTTAAAQTQTRCEQLFELPGVADSEMDRLLVACEQAVEDRPDDPRPADLLGRVLAMVGDARGAIHWTRAAAEMGYAPAQYRLAQMHLIGRDTGRDQDLAFRWMHSAARLGHAQAQYRLGLFYRNGIATEKDTAMALRWLRQAAEQDIAPAQYMLANEYYFGKNLPADFNKALEWMHEAGKNGHPSARRGFFSEAICAD